MKLVRLARMLMAEQGEQRLDILLAILVQHASVLLPATHEAEPREGQGQDRTVDIRTEEDFWKVVRRALVGSSQDKNCF